MKQKGSWLRAGGLWLGLSALASCTPSPPDGGGGGGSTAGGGGTGGSGGASNTAGANAGGAGGASSSGGVGSGGAPADGGSGGGGNASGGANPAGGSPGGGGNAGSGGGAGAAVDAGGSGGAPSAPSGACTPGGSGFDTAAAGVALDRKTCLAWERNDPERDVSGCPLNIRDNKSKLCWEEATKYCTALRLDGKSDWRLPTIAELQTIVVADNYPTFDLTVFPQAVVSIYWSSEKKGEKIVAIDFSNHGMVNDHIGPDGPQAFRCVRVAGK